MITIDALNDLLKNALIIKGLFELQKGAILQVANDDFWHDLAKTLNNVEKQILSTLAQQEKNEDDTTTN